MALNDYNDKFTTSDLNMLSQMINMFLYIKAKTYLWILYLQRDDSWKRDAFVFNQTFKPTAH